MSELSVEGTCSDEVADGFRDLALKPIQDCGSPNEVELAF